VSETKLSNGAPRATSTQVFEYVPGAPPSADELHRDDPMRGELLQLNMGPQHPATHGVLRLAVTLDGETIVDVDPDVGFLHRGKEKSCESLGWHKFFPHTDRLDYVQPLMNNVGYALAVEKLAGLEVPPRGQVVRVLLCELSRIMAHLIYIGTLGIDLGAVTIFFYAFRQREELYNVVDAYTGHRMNNTYVRIGGVYADVDPEVESLIANFLEKFPAALDEIDSLLTRNRIWYDRNRDIGVITREQALAWSLTGPALRASGVDWDLRRKQPYCGYDSYDFDVPVGTAGDCYDRYLVRMREMRESARIAAQALERLKTVKGDVLAEDRRFVLPPKSDVHRSMEELIFQFKVVTDLRLPRGEAYHGIESSKGELGFFIASDGSSKPLRCHIRAPGLMNIQVLPMLARGRLFSDMVSLIGSMDFVMGEVDR
jgi:NADH-quinone oxidoreductase subunit D